MILICLILLVIVNVPAEWDKLEYLIRHGRIKKGEALSKIKEIEPLLKDYFVEKEEIESSRSNWCFPVKGLWSKRYRWG